VITTITAPTAGSGLSVTGSGFTGFGNSEASGGGTNSSASNYPLVQMRSIGNEQTVWLGMASHTGTTYASLPVTNFPAGPALVTVYVNGIPSLTRYITVPTLGHAISVVVTGAGSGTITSTPAGITCSSGGQGTCIASFPTGTSLTLSPATAKGSTFSGWGQDCSGYGTCIHAMTSDYTATATFGLGPNGTGPLVRIAATGNGYNSIANAYGAAISGDVIQAITGPHAINVLLLNRGIDVSFKGGYDQAFTGQGQPSLLQGTLDVSSGSLRADNVKVIY
jgi:hypothetical protein